MHGKLLYNIIRSPWWLLILIAFTIFISPYLISAYLQQSPSKFILMAAAPWKFLSPWVALLFIIFSAISAFNRWHRKKLFMSANSFYALRKMSWQEFELLTGEIMRRKGYKIKERGGAKADGGVDIDAWRGNERLIIQCKQWKTQKVGVNIVREMVGVALHEGANGIYIVTCGYFTKDAKIFSEGKPIVLVDGKILLNWIAELK